MEYWSQVIKSQRARKSLSVLNVFGLSVCIGAALLIMLYVWFELSFDSFHNGDRVYRVESRLYEGATLTDNWATTSSDPQRGKKRTIDPSEYNGDNRKCRTPLFCRR